MIVQIAPVEKNVNETLASLNFAQRVRCVELGAASKHVENGDIKTNGEVGFMLTCDATAYVTNNPTFKNMTLGCHLRMQHSSEKS